MRVSWWCLNIETHFASALSPSRPSQLFKHGWLGRPDRGCVEVTPKTLILDMHACLCELAILHIITYRGSLSWRIHQTQFQFCAGSQTQSDQTIFTEHRLLFRNPAGHLTSGTWVRRSPYHLPPRLSPQLWTHKFYCLASIGATNVLSAKVVKDILATAGLGEKSNSHGWYSVWSPPAPPASVPTTCWMRWVHAAEMCRQLEEHANCPATSWWTLISFPGCCRRTI